jgi:hypothetical protein
MPEVCQNLRWYNDGEALPCPLEELGACVVKTEDGDLVAPSHYDRDLGWVRSLDTEPIDRVCRFAPYQLRSSPASSVAAASDDPGDARSD